MQTSLRSHQHYQQYYDCEIAHHCSIININNNGSESELDFQAAAAGLDQQQQQQHFTRINYQQHTQRSPSNRQVLVHQEQQELQQQHHAHHDINSHLSQAPAAIATGDEQLHLPALLQGSTLESQFEAQQAASLTGDQTAILCYAQNALESANQTGPHMSTYELQQVSQPQYEPAELDAVLLHRSPAVYRNPIEQHSYRAVYYEPAEFMGTTSNSVGLQPTNIEQHASYNPENLTQISSELQPIQMEPEQPYFQYPGEAQVSHSQQLGCAQVLASAPLVHLSHVQVLQQQQQASSAPDYENHSTLPEVIDQAREPGISRTYHTLEIPDHSARPFEPTSQSDSQAQLPLQPPFQDIVQTNVNHYNQISSDFQLHQALEEESLKIANESQASYQIQTSQQCSSYLVHNFDGSTGVSVTHSSGDSNSSAASTSSESSAISEDSSIASSLTRDEKRAREANIPLSYFEIVNLSIDQFNEQLAKHNLSESQLTLIKDIRRRGKNKVAAQSCRKRKMEQIFGLQHEVDHLSSQRRSLSCECEKLMKEHENLTGRYAEICSILQNHLRAQEHQVI